MTAVQPQEVSDRLRRGQRVRLPGETGIVVVRGIEPRSDGFDLFVAKDADTSEVRMVSLTSKQAERVRGVIEDGAAPPEVVLAGLWNEWMLGAVRSARSTVLASTMLKPYPHQMDAVYGHMLTQPLLRFLLADEPGTGKTIMSGLWLREAQRLGLAKRALIVCPAHLVIKWRADFKRFFGQNLREVTAETIRQRALAGSDDDLWIVSLNLAAMKKPVRDALHPDEAGWDAIIFDEAHRMTPTAETFHRVGKELSASVPHAVFLTATPHRGDEWYFRELLHLVDPDVFPTSSEPDSGLPKRRRSDQQESKSTTPLTPGPLHFLRRMKEELVDYDAESLLFKEREAVNVKVPMNPTEQRFYDRALELVLTYFPVRGRSLAAMVYGKRAASSLYALAETLRRRSDKMGTGDASAADSLDDPDDEDDEERVVETASLDAKAEKQAISEMLAELEPMLDPDRLALDELNVSKWEPMIERLAENGIIPGLGNQLVVFTEYADTANWLIRAFKDVGFTAERYSGADNHAERAAIQARFMDGRFEVIVSTDAGNEGIDLQVANVLVNWDIPWSLVRLEQRMGRIHRIGQEHKVSLYNMVALGTREGDAHERLLDRLIEAANELGGRMFDSLNAIMERVESGTTRGDCENLLRLFYDSSPSAASEGDLPTLEEIRRARDEYFAELRALSSEVDVAAANAARHDDHLARVNPIIVERYLTRIAQGELLRCDPAPLGDAGFFYLSASPAVHGWQLPASLRLANGTTLVATRADARQKAIDDGLDRAADTIMLGPSDPALTTLVKALRERVEPEMWQGALLIDRSAREDYTLFVYECDITEGSEGHNPKHRPRKSTLSWLIRVSASGEARTVSWDTLPNLTPAHDLTPVPLSSEEAIERWFPCAEVSKYSAKGWGAGFAEKSLFTWFASRPLAQAKAAVICSLLPWPDDEHEQKSLKKLVREAMKDYDAKNSELRKELAKHYPNGAKMCDPFSGRAMIPLEAARLGIQTWGIDYSPVATLAGKLLADYPLRDWDNEPDLPFDGNLEHQTEHFTEPRLLRDVGFVLDLVGNRYADAMGEFYPFVGGKRPWGYVWAVTLPCTNCGNKFPLTGSLALRNPKTATTGRRARPADDGQSYRIITDDSSGTFRTEVRDGQPDAQPTLVSPKGKAGKSGVCCFCDHVHPLDTLKRMMRDGLTGDAMLAVADLDDDVGKRYREPTDADLNPLASVAAALESEAPFRPGLPAVPTEPIDPWLTRFIGPVNYGYRSWGELCNARQTLGFVRLARIIDKICREMLAAGISQDYAAALTGYAASNLVRSLKFRTRSAAVQVSLQKVSHIFFNDSGISHSFDYFEIGCGTGAGTWGSLAVHTVRGLAKQVVRVAGCPVAVMRGSATDLPLPDGSLDAVVTDPPYDSMINYCDSSDLMYVWLKRALVTAHPWLGVTTDSGGLQEKTKEAVIKFTTADDNDHRTEEHYKECITKAFDQARLTVGSEGVVSIVFGHGDPDAWGRVLTAISDAGLVLTGSWPCSTEKGGKQTGEYIDNTIMMACRVAATNRPVGDLRRVDDEVRAEIAQRVPSWTADGLADSDQRMAAIAPAMEVVGRYSEVRDFTGVPVPIQHFLGLAHKAVEEAANVRIDKFRLTDFDERTRFAISWARQHGRRVAAASEARWQRLSYDMSDSDVEGIITKEKGGSRLAYGDEFAETSRSHHLHSTSAVIDLALAVAHEGRSLSDIADALHLLDRENDEMLWAAMTELARLVGEGDPDGQLWAWAVRNRQLICGQAQRARTEHQQELEHKAAQDSQTRLF